MGISVTEIRLLPSGCELFPEGLIERQSLLKFQAAQSFLGEVLFIVLRQLKVSQSLSPLEKYVHECHENLILYWKSNIIKNVAP